MSTPWSARLGALVLLALVAAPVGCRAPARGADEPEVAAGPGRRGLGVPGETSALPPTVEANLSTAAVTLTLSLGELSDRAGPGLRSLILYAEGTLRLEPHGLWPDGTPVGADAALGTDELDRLLRSMARAGFFEPAGRFHSPRHADPMTSPPAGSREGPPPWPDEPHLAVDVTVHDVDRYHHFAAPVGLADAAARLEVLAGALEGEAARTVGTLAREAERVASLPAVRPGD